MSQFVGRHVIQYCRYQQETQTIMTTHFQTHDIHIINTQVESRDSKYTNIQVQKSIFVVSSLNVPSVMRY